MKLITVNLLAAALIAGVLRRPEESPLQVAEDEGERLIEAGVAKKVKVKAEAEEKPAAKPTPTPTPTPTPAPTPT